MAPERPGIDPPLALCEAPRMACPLCDKRKGRRACPALGRDICTVCCGTKRLTEIVCPPDCGFLAAAQAHPPASIRKQQQRDFEFAMPIVHRLSETAYGLVLAFQDTIRRYRPTALPPLADQDVAEATRALAATLETAGRGIIFEHQAQSIPAQRLVTELRGTFAAMARTPSSTLERDAASGLRRIEEAARRAAGALGGSNVAYLDFLARLPELSAPPSAAPNSEAATAQPAPSRLILP